MSGTQENQEVTTERTDESTEAVEATEPGDAVEAGDANA